MRWVMVCTLSLSAWCATVVGVEARIFLDRATQDYLEGKWAITTDKSSPAAACKTGASEEEYTLEFRKSGGTLLIVDDVDADFRVPITEASGDRKELELVLKDDDGTLFKKIRLRPVNHVLMKLQENVGRVPTSIVDGFAFRCADPRHGVVAALPANLVVGLSLRGPQGSRLVEVLGNETDKQVCDLKDGRREFELELIGPSSYSINEYDGQSYGRTWLINGSELRKDGTIVFQTDAHGPKRTFTLKPDGKHFRVPELSIELVRCSNSS